MSLLIGGMHGDEAATILLLEAFREVCAGKLEGPTAILPLANPDGYVRRSRYNARGVDINRNFGFAWSASSEEPSGAEPWSEPETRILRDLILDLRPQNIVSLHWALAEIDADGPQSSPLAHAMWEAMSEEERAPYRLRLSELGRGLRRLERSYAVCPGSLGQWCGYGLSYPDTTRPAMVTLELPYDPEATFRPSPLPDDHLDFLRALWARDPEGYLAGVRPGVEKMLLAACRPAP